MYRVVLLLSAAIIVTLPVYSQPQAQLGRWGMRTPLLEPFSEHAVAELDGKIYVIAGNTNDRGTVATILVYDSANDSWTHTTPLPVAVNHNMAATMNGKLYVFGGQTATQGDSPFVDTVYEFNPATEQLTERAPMSLARSAGATAVVNGKIYVAGGRPPRGHDFAVYDPVANTWGRLPDLPTQRNHLAVAAINGKVYVAGGRFGPGSTSDVEISALGSQRELIDEVVDNAWVCATCSVVADTDPVVESHGLPPDVQENPIERRFATGV